MEQRLKLPVGIEFFDEIRTSGYYYIDKTKLLGGPSWKKLRKRKSEKKEKHSSRKVTAWHADAASKSVR